MPKYVTCQNKIKSIGPQILWLAQFMYCARFLDFTARYCHCELSLIKMKLLHQRFGIYMFILSAVLWILSWIFVTCLNLAAARQVRDQSNHPVQIFGNRALPGFSDQRRILARRAAPRHSLVRHQHLHRLCQQADRVSRLHYLSCHRKLSSQPQGP